ncbi:MAG TPA: nitrate- and nitrite sensing domain-containing protein [Micromonospora sp.]|nr:nitrate- and nitrite sensing domain-containing protein [Micromonospora sp.]
MNTRNWPIRSKIIALVVVPLSALLALWIFATTLTVGPAMNLLTTQTLLDDIGVPGEALVSELKRERRLSLIYLAGGGDDEELHEQRKRTDVAINEFRRRASSTRLSEAANELLASRLDETFTALDILPAGRGYIDRHEMDRTGALGLYSSIISATFRTFFGLAMLPDEDINRRVRALTALGQSREMLAQADALLAGVFTAGRFAEGEHAQFIQVVATQRFLSESAVADLPVADRIAYQRLVDGEAFVRLRTIEDKLIDKGRTGAVPPINAEAWYSSQESVQQQMRSFELNASGALADDSRPMAAGVLIRLAIAGVLGLIAVVVSVVLAVRIGRALIRRLTGLRAAALELAKERLPSVVARLRRGEEVDVEAETPPLKYGSDEIGQVAEAFSEVQRTAVRSAVEEAALRRGLSDVFLNIARRSQTLLHRQLAVLDQMERRTTDPDELADLFRIDHMATRMRRHAEDLVILAGAAPGRGWRKPVAMIDVIRGAVSEVEDYTRVDIATVQPAATVGRAVGDVIHLLAELIENATVFSPPQTRVQIIGQALPKGYAIEIEDRGLGMTMEAIEEANTKLAAAPEFDVANSARLGLFVVARLAARHGVQVRLRPSPYGGLTAVALLPSELVVMPDPRTSSPSVPRRRDVDPAAGRTALSARAELDATQEIRPVMLLSAATPATSPAPSVDSATRLLALPGARGPAPGTETESAAAPASAEEQAAPVAPAEPDGADGAAKVDGEVEGLPRRVRQVRVPPRSSRAGAGGATAGSEPSFRDPDEIRAAMAALQAGTIRGRRDAGAGPAPEQAARSTATPPAGTEVPALDTSPVHDGESSDTGRNA